MSAEYQDKWITCTADAIEIRGYYFPWGTKHIPYDSIRSVERVSLGAFTGRGRIWGTAHPGRWANFDPRRPSKTVGFDLNLGGSVEPLVTPDDPETFERALRNHIDPSLVRAGSRRSKLA